MRSAKQGKQAAIPNDIFVGTGEMSALMRSLDWSKTPLGPINNWSPALRMMARFLLANRFPLLLWWGPQFCQLYNDAYRPILGKKHPQFLGRPVSECWSEIWHILEPLIQTPFAGGPSTWIEDFPLEINRHGFLEETHFTVAYSPVPDETVPSGIGGVLATVHEISEKVVGERRTMALRDLSASILEERSAEEACARAAGVLAKYPKDVPFALLYLLDTERKVARLAEATGLGENYGDIAPAVIEVAASNNAWPLSRVIETGRTALVENLGRRFASIPPNAWSDPSDRAAVVPIRSNLAHQLAGFLIAGISPRLRFDELYGGFLELAASQIATAVSNARVYEEERKRSEALAELDRAKTLFFSNVSHEFRTPLTLMLGPLEELAAKGAFRLGSEENQHVDVARRNALRLLKLVNTLLDFSRIETGRVQAVYEPTDLGGFTAEIASVFRSAMEKAGLIFRVHCEPLPEPGYVDRDMWEKIVLNLLSNAFKFTFQGEVRVVLKAVNGRAELTVADTGTGIPEPELSRVFERFHRIEGARGRSYEGTGIGLALVSELAKLHGGSVRVESVEGRGSTFTVDIPLGKTHLPPEQVEEAGGRASTAARADAYVDETLSWLPQDSGPVANPGRKDAQTTPAAEEEGAAGDRIRHLVLLADDNADLRAYVSRLLRQEYRVRAVSNGEEALAAARQLHPDLILSDIMMPGMDGFAVLQAIRQDPQTQAIPVILLSARAGEESRVEGLQAGADDYLVKPFTARELMARVEAHIRMAQTLRQVSELEERLRAKRELEQQRVRAFLQQVPAAIAMLQGPEHRWSYVNPAYLHVIGRDRAEELLGKTIRETLPELEGQGYLELLDQVYQTGEPVSGTEAKVLLNRGPGGRQECAYFNFLYQPLKDDSGKVEGVFVHGVDVTQQVEARRGVEESEEQFRMLAESIPQLDWMANADGWIYWYNQRWYDYTGTKPEQMVGWGWQSVHDPEVLPQVIERWKESIRTGQPFEMVFPLRGADGEFRPFLTRIVPVRDAEGKVVRWFGTNTDITAQQSAEDALRRSEERLLAALAASDTGTYRWNPSTDTFVEFDENLKHLFGLPATAEVRTTEDFVRLVHGDDIPDLLAAMERSRRGADLEMEYRVVLSDGSIRWLYDRGKMVWKDGKPHYLVGACTDVTTRKRDEISSLRLAAIVESSDDAIVSKDLNGIVASWNAAAERVFGYTAEEMVGQPILKIIPPELHHDEVRILETLRRGERIDHFETVRVTKSGERLDVSLTISPVRDEKGRIVGAAKIARDITQRKKTEDALRMSDKLATTGRLAATVAHEINNPLESIVNLVYLAKSQKGLPENVREYLRAAEEELDRVSQLTRQALGFYREKTAATTVRVGPIISQLRTVFSPKTTNKRIDLQMEVDQDPEIVAVPGELRQLFANLLSNSIDAVPIDGTIRVRVSQAREFNSKARPGTRVTIADSGPGITPAHRSRIFEPFFTTKKEVGTGLGLWVSKGIVERHGGTIRLRSRTTPGCSGTVFSVFLPADAAEGHGRRESVLKEAV